MPFKWSKVHIHPTADVSLEAQVGEGTSIWHQAQVREGAVIGRECILGKGVYVDLNVRVGDRCKLQNGVFVYQGATLEEGVLLGPGVMLLNDKRPRAVNADGSSKRDADWQVSPTHVGRGAGIGGGAMILPGVRIGRWAMVGSGSVVTRDVPDYGLAWGNPARLHGYVCPCGRRLEPGERRGGRIAAHCPACGWGTTFDRSRWGEIGDDSHRPAVDGRGGETGRLGGP